jgi:hypothetical protein
VITVDTRTVAPNGVGPDRFVNSMLSIYGSMLVDDIYIRQRRPVRQLGRRCPGAARRQPDHVGSAGAARPIRRLATRKSAPGHVESVEAGPMVRKASWTPATAPVSSPARSCGNRQHRP